MSWKSANWIGLAVELLRVLIAALAGYGTSELTAEKRVGAIVAEEMSERGF